jgi:hypothetical protein
VAQPANRVTERALALAPALGPAAITIAAVAVLAWTWRTWPDPVVDFGRELYQAWQVAEGRTLYVDLAHFSGPLSVELNALLFRVFGTSLRTLVIANIVLAGVCAALLYDLLVRTAGRVAATAGGLVFVLLFACGQYTRISNYNWVCPYSHELTHGLIVALAALWLLDRRARTGRDAWLFGVGIASGLLVLTKAETMLAGGLAIGVGLLLVLLGERASPRRWALAVALVVAGTALPLALTVVRYAGRMPFDTLLEWPLGHWLAAVRPELRTASFYQQGMGLDDGGGNLGAALMAFGGEAVLLAAAAVAAMLLRPLGGQVRLGVAVALAVATGAAVWRWVSMDTWGFTVPRALPIWTAVLAVAALVELVRHPDDPETRRRATVKAALAVLATVLLAKMLLNVRIFHYGFVLAMPAAVLVVAGAVAWLPAYVDRMGGYGGAVRAVAIGAFVAGVATHLTFQNGLIAGKRLPIGRGADAFLIDDRGTLAARLLQQIESHVKPGETLIVMPQGVMLNFLARRTNPTPYYLFDRTSRSLWGEAEITQRVQAARPDWVALIERTSLDVFSTETYVELEPWVRQHYTEVWRSGKPFRGRRGPAVMLLRRTPDA